MGKSIDSIVEDKIKRAANVVDVIGDFIELRKRGVEYQCLCPFHDDHTLGSFSINPNKGIYKCFKCDASGDAVEFLMKYPGTRLSYPDALRYLAKKYSIFIDDESANDERFKNIRPSVPKALQQIHKDMLVMPREVVRSVVQNRQSNIFIDWFRSLPWSNSKENDQMARVDSTLWLYCVGSWRDGRVVFFQIDDEGRPRGGKLMRYGTNGKRDKTSNPGWLHNQEGVRELCDMEHHEYRATLFGMHLMKKYPDADINIVESEKTALICANAYGQPEKNLWMACGGLKFLKLESLKPLLDSGRRVWLWPDKDGIGEWENKVRDILNDKVMITKKFLETYWTDDDGPKADVADIIVRHMQHPETIVKHEQAAAEPGRTKWADGPPFVDADELMDPRVRQWRDIMGRMQSSGWGKWPESKVAEVKSVAEIIKDNPILTPLIN